MSAMAAQVGNYTSLRLDCADDTPRDGGGIEIAPPSSCFIVLFKRNVKALLLSALKVYDAANLYCLLLVGLLDRQHYLQVE